MNGYSGRGAMLCCLCPSTHRPRVGTANGVLHSFKRESMLGSGSQKRVRVSGCVNESSCVKASVFSLSHTHTSRSWPPTPTPPLIQTLLSIFSGLELAP